MISELPLQIKKAIRRYKPVSAEGLVLYPVRVKDYDQFQLARLALEALQQSFPVAYLSMPILQAFYKLDYEAAVSGKDPTGLFYSALLGLALSLRIGEGLDEEKRVKQFTIRADSNDPSKLLRVTAFVNGEEMISVTPVQYARIRPIMAEQNGIYLYGTDANPELVEAKRLMRRNDLTGTIDDEIDFVSLLGDTEDVDEWPILKLQNKAEAMLRVLDYMLCGINEGAGMQWKGGNPVPHPWLRKEQVSSGVIAASEFMNGAGERAIAQEGKETPL